MEEKCESQVMLEYLRGLFMSNIVNPSLYAEVAQKYGPKRAAEALISPKIPTLSRMRKGRFGELLTTNILAEFYEYEVPIQKMKFLITSDESQPSTDVIAVKKQKDRVIEVCYLESKLRTTEITSMGKDAFLQLKNDLAKKIPDMLAFVVNQLYEKRDPFYQEMLKFMMERVPSVAESFRIGIISEKNKWSETCLVNLGEVIKEKERYKIEVDIIRISCLDQLVKDLFESFGIEADLEDE